MEYKALAEKNEFGFWVPTVKFPDEVIAHVGNAKHTEAEALCVAEKIVEAGLRLDAVNAG